MDRTYGLPIAFAAALHGAVLFGFTKSPRVAVAKETKPAPEWVRMTAPEEPPPVIETSDERGPKAQIDTPQPVTSPEPPAIAVEQGFTIKPPPVVAFDPSNISTIPLNPAGIGTPDGNPWGNNVIRGEFLDNPPRTRLQAAPLYPREAVTQGLRGEVTVEFMVDEAGNVLDPRVVQSSNRLFEEASVRAVARWKFEPGRRDGRIVRFRMAVPLVFNLNE